MFCWHGVSFSNPLPLLELPVANNSKNTTTLSGGEAGGMSIILGMKITPFEDSIQHFCRQYICVSKWVVWVASKSSWVNLQ